MKDTKNPNCDNDKCSIPNGEIRVLPLNGDSNALLCRTCYHHEMQHRRAINKNLSVDAQWKLPLWEDLEPYNTGE